MENTKLAYDVCRCYIEDHRGLIDDAVLNRTLGWVRSRDVSSLSTITEVIPGAYQSLALCRFSRQIAAFFKKNAAFVDQDVCSTNAQKSFETAETLCRITNKRIDHFARFPDRLDPETRIVMEKTKNIIANILGDITPFFQELPELVKITSGATATRSRRDSLPFMKMNLRNIPSTSRCKPLIEQLLNHYGFTKHSTKTCNVNRVETVPKNYKTDRTIACEPDGNVPFQLACDAYVKSRLRKFGFDLSDQSKNQELARIASIDGSLATIDMQQASDTISLDCVNYLLPSRWSTFLMAIRSPYGRGFGKLYKYAKFSSMGNGATFVIETLIFGALAKAVSNKGDTVSAYGDDVIIPSAHVEAFTRHMRFLGFTVNQSKSFSSGLFRESCGADWFDGSNVTPFYLRGKFHGKPETCHIVNGLASIAFPGGKLEGLLRSLVKDRQLPLVPYSENTMIGVWIDKSSAYSLKLIKTTHSIPMMKAFIAQSKTYTKCDSRSYYLWHLDAWGRKERNRSALLYSDANTDFLRSYNRTGYVDVSDVIVRSKVPALIHKYKFKWVRWFPPATATPVHLYRWTELIIRDCR